MESTWRYPEESNKEYMDRLVNRCSIQTYGREMHKQRFGYSRTDIMFGSDACEIYSIDENGLEIHNTRMEFVYSDYIVEEVPGTQQCIHVRKKVV